MQVAERTLMANRGAFDRLAAALMAHETVEKAELRELLGAPPSGVVDPGSDSDAALREMAPWREPVGSRVG